MFDDANSGHNSTFAGQKALNFAKTLAFSTGLPDSAERAWTRLTGAIFYAEKFQKAPANH